ncbi:ABC transporter permease [Parasphingorhabdus pacifica]
MSTPRTTNAVWLVARREITGRVRSRAFALGTLATIAMMAGYAALMFFIGQSSATAVGFTGQSTVVSGQLARVSESMGEPIEEHAVADLEEGRHQLQEGRLDAVVTAGPPGRLTVLAERELDQELRAALDAVLEQRVLYTELAKAGLDPADLQAALSEARIDVQLLNPPDPHLGERLGLAMAAGMLLYFFLIVAGQAVAQGVVEEKTSRVVELLLATIRPRQLLAGKVVGIGIAVLIQLLIIIVAGLVATSVGDLITLPSDAVLGTALWTLVWFLLGFFTYATVMAAAASLVSRQEDLQSVTTPVIMLLIVPFLIGLSVLPDDPQSGFGAVLSMVPGFSPVLMPMRIALGVAAPWEIAVSLVTTALAVLGLLRLGGRIYGRAVLHTGARLKLVDALRSR